MTLERKLAPETENPLIASTKEWYKILTDRIAKRNPDFKKFTDWGKEYIFNFINSRKTRAQEIISQELNQVRQMASGFWGKNIHVFFVDCIDGRTTSLLETSHPPGIGGTMSTQAAEIPAIKRGAEKDQPIIDGTDFQISAIKRLLREKTESIIFYAQDNHFGCAARGKRSQAIGQAKDGGLAEDIKSKIENSIAISTIESEIKQTNPKAAHIIPQLYSYDPHDGSITLGLEMHAENVERTGFTEEVLNKLTDEKKIVNTWSFLNNPNINEQLKKIVKSADFEKNYSQSLLQNWQAITDLYDSGKGTVFNTIVSSIRSAYETSGWTISNSVDDLTQHTISQINLQQKAKMMLQNLVTRYSIAQTAHDWPFAHHIEQGVVITEADYRPVGTNHEFTVFSQATTKSVFDNVGLAIGLVRGFRINKSIKDPFDKLSPEEFVSAPIIISNQAILRKLSIEDHQIWKKLSQINLIKLFEEIKWDNSYPYPKDFFQNLLGNQLKNINFSTGMTIIKSVHDIYMRMWEMMNDKDFRNLLLDGNVIVVNQLVDENREVRINVPFII